MRNLPPLPALRAFEAVARLGSVVKAAAELHVTHGAISQQLRVLEECLGFDLFKRGGRRLAVNEDGRIYAMRVRAALSDIAHATTDVLALPRPDELVVALLPSFGAHWLVRRLPSFCAAHPNLKIALRASLDFVDFAIDRVDVAIRMGPGAWEGLSNQPLFDDEHLIAAAPHFNGGRLPRTPAAILRAPLLRSVESWNPWLLAAGLPDTELSGPIFTDSNLLMEAVRQGQGVALTRRSLAHDALRSGELVQLTKIVAPYPESYWLVWPSRSEGTPKLLAFSQWLMGQVRAYQAELAEH